MVKHPLLAQDLSRQIARVQLAREAFEKAVADFSWHPSDRFLWSCMTERARELAEASDACVEARLALWTAEEATQCQREQASTRNSRSS